MKPKSNGIVDLVDERTLDSNSFFCMRLVQFIETTNYDEWMQTFEKAKKGHCPFKRKCDKFQKTIRWKRKRRIQNSAARRSIVRKKRRENAPDRLPSQPF